MPLDEDAHRLPDHAMAVDRLLEVLARAEHVSLVEVQLDRAAAVEEDIEAMLRSAGQRLGRFEHLARLVEDPADDTRHLHLRKA